MAAVGGPGLEAQMHALDPDRVDELVVSTARTTSRCTTRSSAAPGWTTCSCGSQAKGGGSGSSRRSAARPWTSPSPAADRAPVRGDRRRRRDRAPQARSRTRCCSRSSGSTRRPDEAAYVGDSPFDIRAARPAASTRSASRGETSTHGRCWSRRSRTLSSTHRRSCLASSSRDVDARAAELRDVLNRGADRYHSRGRPDHVRRRVRPALRRAGRARAGASRARPAGLAHAPRRRPAVRRSRKSATSRRWARSRR